MGNELSRKTFWVTNGADGDGYFIVVKVPKIARCNHCYKRDCAGFGSIGYTFERNGEVIFRYAICNNCLYRPSLGLVEHNFINVSKNRDTKYRTENK